jgi:hypothetical protein
MSAVIKEQENVIEDMRKTEQDHTDEILALRKIVEDQEENIHYQARKNEELQKTVDILMINDQITKDRLQGIEQLLN